MKRWSETTRQKLFLLLLLASCVFQSWSMIGESADWRLDRPALFVSVFYFLPRALLDNPLLSQVCFAIFIVGALLWFSGRWLKSSTLICLVSFFCITSQYLQNSPWEDHRSGLLTFFLATLAGAAFLQKNPGQWKPYVWKMLFAGGTIFYFLAGASKIFYSGFSWANGTSLQAIVFIYATQPSWLKSAILNEVDLAKILQIGVIWIELSAPLAFFLRKYRIIWAVGLLFVHLGIELLFQYHYWTHAFLAIYLALASEA